MSLREIKTFPAEVLRNKAHPVKHFDENIQTLADDMVETLRAAPGVGLAAPQIGVSERLIIVEFGDERDDTIPKQLFVLANPEIVEESEEAEFGVEGCLSVPGLVGEVERAKIITVQAQNQFGKKTRIRASGWLARIFQHEIDHLNGVLFIDRAEKIWKPDPEEMENIPD
jgi:peptide deformylase